MENLPKGYILQYNFDTLEAVRKELDLHKPGVMKEAVDLLEEWTKKQNHFTKKLFNRRYLESMIIANKGSIEKVKHRLDKACTFRTLNPELFSTYNIRYIYDKDIHTLVTILPKMTKNHERVILLKNTALQYDPMSLKIQFRTIPSFAEYVRLNDYATSNYAVLDFMDADVADLAIKIDFRDCQETATYLLQCCAFRLKGFYIISSSKSVEYGVAMLKQLFGAKLRKRIYVLRNRESLKEVIDADILPREYGGNERSMEELHKQWLEVLTTEEHIDYLRDMHSARTDESLRMKDIFNDQYMGMPGTFRQLNVD